MTILLLPILWTAVLGYPVIDAVLHLFNAANAPAEANNIPYAMRHFDLAAHMPFLHFIPIPHLYAQSITVYPSNQISQTNQIKCLANQIKSMPSSKQIDLCRFVKLVKLYV